MHISNNTDRILVFGKCHIDPASSAELPSEFHDHPVLDRMIRLQMIIPQGMSQGQLTAKKTVEKIPSIVDQLASGMEQGLVPSDEPEPRREDDPTGLFPEGWDSMHFNKKRAWAKRQDDMILLGKLHMLESSDKVREMLQVRIDTLETRT